MIRQLQLEFEQIIEGLGPSIIDTTKRSSGAKINRLFHEDFQSRMSEIEQQLTGETIRSEIAIAVENCHAIRPGLFIPDKAYETIVRKQIMQFEAPCLICVDLVVMELNNVIKKCMEKVSSIIFIFSFIRDGSTTELSCYTDVDGSVSSASR